MPIADSPEHDLPASQKSVDGAAAIYGFLYQILASAHELVEAQFGKTDGYLPPSTVTAILEPSAGGEVSIEARPRTVIQFKHRKTAVSVSEMAEKVLPDLFKAHCDRDAAIYVLQTAHGASKPALELIAALKGHAATGLDLDAARTGNPRLATAIALLQGIWETRYKGSQTFEAMLTSFIERFTVASPIPFDTLRTRVLGFLAERVAYREGAEASLDTLIGYLVSQSRYNDAVVTVEELLTRLGLPGSLERQSDTATNRLAEKAREVLIGVQKDPR